jgi:hypothetical protein
MKHPAPGYVFVTAYQPVGTWMVQQRGATRSALNSWISLGFPSNVKLHPRDDCLVWVTPTYGYTVISPPPKVRSSGRDATRSGDAGNSENQDE